MSMRTASALIVIALFGCTKEHPGSDPSPTPGPGVRSPAPAPTPAPAAVTVAITAVSLAGDCGQPAADSRAEQKRASEQDSDRAQQRKACEQTSMQLSVTGAAGTQPIQIRVKRVELFDDKGALIGELTPRTPTVWSQDGTYRPWDQLVAPAQALSVSYALSEPRWGAVTERWNRTYVLRAVITVGATDQTVQRDVHVAAPATLPPDVET